MTGNEDTRPVRVDCVMERMNDGSPIWLWDIPEFGVTITVNIMPPSTSDPAEHIERINAVRYLLSQMLGQSLLDDMDSLAAEKLKEYSTEDIDEVLDMINKGRESR